MKTLSSNKSIQQCQRKPTKKFRPLPFLPHPHSLSFQDCQELILKAQILPLNIELQLPPYKQLTFIISHINASIKSEQQSCCIPFHLGKSRWLRIVLGQQIKRVDLKATYQDHRIEKNHIFKDLNQWKIQIKEEITSLNSFFLEPLLKLMKNRSQKREKKIDLNLQKQISRESRDRKIDGFQKESIGTFIKTKLSERHSFRSNITKFRTKQEIALTNTEHYECDSNKFEEMMDRRENITVHHRKQIRKASSTLETEKFIHHYPSHMKESNTSTSISNQPDIKFPKRMRRIRDIIQNKAAKSLKDTDQEDVSDLFQPKPKFCQNINISQEEIDLKRKKFDSQFIYKQSTLVPQTTKEILPDRNESEVTEDIIKMQNSQTIHHLQDTLEKGFTGENNKTNKELQESGTLYESVYQ